MKCHQVITMQIGIIITNIIWMVRKKLQFSCNKICEIPVDNVVLKTDNFCTNFFFKLVKLCKSVLMFKYSEMCSVHSVKFTANS